MPELPQINISFLGLLKPYLVYIFFILCALNLVYLIKQFWKGYDLFDSWNDRLLSINQTGNLKEEEIEEIEKESSTTHPVISDLIGQVRSISSDRKELSLDEIHHIIDPKIKQYEISLNESAARFIYLGLAFTVLGLLTGLFDLKGEVNAESIKMMLSNQLI